MHYAIGHRIISPSTVRTPVARAEVNESRGAEYEAFTYLRASETVSVSQCSQRHFATVLAKNLDEPLHSLALILAPVRLEKNELLLDEPTRHSDGILLRDFDNECRARPRTGAIRMILPVLQRAGRNKRGVCPLGFTRWRTQTRHTNTRSLPKPHQLWLF